ncbi:MAG: type II 3-dehydroquinate dehydratase [Bacteroidota bacterium]|jgi:3-dehydroquinate dehydratase-2
MLFAVINGPNLNLLGSRQPEIYGVSSLDALESQLKNEFKAHQLIFKQSNLEGELVEFLQQLGMPGQNQVQGIVLNAGGYSHTSVAIADAVASIPLPVVSVHISNIYSREPERHKELIAKYAAGGIYGLGIQGYSLALQWLINRRP